ncbi:MAG: STAS domain-containing protein [bacterium]|nr:STAS domain-containing protein [bacterium]
MEVISIVIGDVVVIKLNGDLRSRDDITGQFQSYLYTGKSKFIINFANVRAVNSIGLSTLLEFKHLAEAAGGSIILCMLKDEVKRVLNVTRLDEIFSIFDDEDTALAGFIKGLPLMKRESAISRHRN